jgi:predicted transcriptional regulator of viral defense system
VTHAALLAPTGFFSYGTACTHHGFTEQGFAEVYVACDKPHRPRTVRSTRYVFVFLPPAGFFGFEETNVFGSVVKMATPGRALIDALDRPQYAGGIREVARIAAKAARRLDWSQLHGYLGQWQESAIVQRLGYLLDLSKTTWPSGARERLLALVHPKSKVHPGPRREWGTGGHLSLPWGIIENVPREQLYDREREPGCRKRFPKAKQ